MAKSNAEIYRATAIVFLVLGIVLLLLDVALLLKLTKLGGITSSHELPLVAFICLMISRGFQRASRRPASPAAPTAN